MKVIMWARFQETCLEVQDSIPVQGMTLNFVAFYHLRFLNCLLLQSSFLPGHTRNSVINCHNVDQLEGVLGI